MGQMFEFQQKHEPFSCALNTSTIKGFELGIVEEAKLASKAGFSGIEPWIRELESYTATGGSLSDLRKRFADLGLVVVGGIAFAQWASDDEEEHREGLEQARREMDMIAQVGGCCIAAPPFGEVSNVTLPRFAQYYRELLAVGKSIGVVPLLELWGHAERLSRLGEVMHVALDCGDPSARILLDVYHLHKGGNCFDSLRILNGDSIGLLHINDYPAEPAREDISDSDRVWPGDGVAQVPEILRTLRDVGFKGMVSLELFNPEYWHGDPLGVLCEGLSKTKMVIEQAGIPQAGVAEQ